MNKKFLSVVVFGALLASSAGTFTSCKDYDDDIDAVNGRIDELAKSLSDLQAKVGSFVKSVTYDPATGKLTVMERTTVCLILSDRICRLIQLVWIRKVKFRC